MPKQTAGVRALSHEVGQGRRKEKQSFAKTLTRARKRAWRGLSTLWKTALSLNGHSVLYDCGLTVGMTLPITAFCCYLVTNRGYTFGREISNYIGLAVSILLVFRLETSYKRYWEARSMLSVAHSSVMSISLLAITQYHRHFTDPGHEVKVCLEDIRRFLCLYWFTMVNQLHGVDPRQENIEEYITEDELEMLTKRGGNHAVIVVKWVGSRLMHLEQLGYISPLQLHETNDGLEGMIEAFDGLIKMKDTKVPFVVRQMCTALTMFFVYVSPLSLATTFRDMFTEFTTILARTLLSSFLVGVCYFAMNTTARRLEYPLGQYDHDLPISDMGRALAQELSGIFHEHIPPVVGVLEPTDDKSKPNFQKKVKVGKSAFDDIPPRGGHLKSADGKARIANGNRLT